MKKIIYLLIVFSVLSCSSSKKKEEKQKTPVLPAAQVTTVHPQTFSTDELKRIELLEHYRRLREEAFAKKKIVQKVKIEKKKVTKVKRLDDGVKTPTPIETISPTPVVKSLVSDELRIQLDQHMAYYCIKFESRFSRPSDCRAHAENILKDCQDKKQTEPSLNLIQCLKKNM